MKPLKLSSLLSSLTLSLLNLQQLPTEILERLFGWPELNPQDLLRFVALRCIPHRFFRQRAYSRLPNRCPLGQLWKVRSKDVRNGLACNLACTDDETIATSFTSVDSCDLGCCYVLGGTSASEMEARRYIDLLVDRHRGIIRLVEVEHRFCC